MNKKLKELLAIDREVLLLESAAELLAWDLETYLPKNGVPFRAEQVAYLSDLIHRKATDDRVGELIAELESDPPQAEWEQRLVREWKRNYERQKKLPVRLVRELAQTTGKAQAEWAESRKNDDFKAFLPTLEKIISLKKEEAECLGYKKHPYDPLLDEYEPDTDTEFITQLFSDLRRELVKLMDKIKSAPQIKDDVLRQSFPPDDQKKLAKKVLEAIGFPRDRARLDTSEHPFTISPGPDDVRITAKYDPDFFNSGFFSVLHEGGHGLYELGYDKNISETMLGNGASLGMHESQSRFWENGIGRSLPFWEWVFPAAAEIFSGNFRDTDPADLYRGVNRVEPSFIRIEADEVTYNLHIILRFNLEKALITDNLQVKDLPDAWRSESKELLGIVPPDDRHGVLQDIHWSAGLFGYFPTYTLGNLYAAQFKAVMEQEISGYDDLIRDGDFSPILEWLRSNIHTWGKVKTPEEICRKATGTILDADPFLKYIRNKSEEVYKL